MVKVLLAEKDARSAVERSKWLTSHHYVVERVVDAISVLSFLESNKVDVVLLVGDSFSRSGIELCKEYRQRGGQTPILMVAPQATNLETAELALDSGVDDFVSSECGLPELSARIRALLRRPPGLLGSKLYAGPITFDTSLGTVTKNGVEVHLQPMELNLLEFFLRHPNQVFSARTLHVRIWSGQIGGGSISDTVRTHIKTLRKKLDDEHTRSIITTAHGRGYKLVP